MRHVHENSATLRAGDWVVVRNKDEILKTLNKNGELEDLPFMPEMFEFCGKQFQVIKRAHKTCDPPNGMGARRMFNAVHLNGLRCTGESHGGCQARCLIFWKESWLKKVHPNTGTAIGPPLEGPLSHKSYGVHTGCTELDVVAGTQAQTEEVNANGPVFMCQSTKISQATVPWRWWDLRQYVEDYTSGNVRLSQFVVAFVVFAWDQLASAGLGLGCVLRWIYDMIQQTHQGTPYPFRLGKIAPGIRTPSANLGVQRGDVVTVRSHTEILATIDEAWRNRGMSFDPEMVPYCGGTYRVLDRITRIIDEKSGRMLQLKNDCIMLEGVVCRGCYSTHRRFCPRSIYPYWREIWLARLKKNVCDTDSR